MSWSWTPAGDQNFWAEESVTGLRLWVERQGNQYHFNGYVYLQQQVAQEQVPLYGDSAIVRHNKPPKP